MEVQLKLWVPIVKPGLEVDREVLPFREIIIVILASEGLGLAHHLRSFMEATGD